MTNSIRPVHSASLPEQGEAQKACRAEGLCVQATAGAVRWLETECQKARHVKQGDLSGNWEVFKRVPPAPLRRLRPAEEPATQESERP